MLIILFSIFRNNFFVISSKPLNIIVAIFCFVATIASVLCIYIAVPELFYVRKNRKGSKNKSKDFATIPFPFERIICLVQENDIVEFEIKSNDHVIKIGASSDNKFSSSVFLIKDFTSRRKNILQKKSLKKNYSNMPQTGK